MMIAVSVTLLDGGYELRSLGATNPVSQLNFFVGTIIVRATTQNALHQI